MREDPTLQKLWGQGRDAGAELPAAPSVRPPTGAHLQLWLVGVLCLWGFFWSGKLSWGQLLRGKGAELDFVCTK